jgi:hypothetical protein
MESGRGLPHSKTLARSLAVHGRREALWSAAVLCRFVSPIVQSLRSARRRKDFPKGKLVFATELVSCI